MSYFTLEELVFYHEGEANWYDSRLGSKAAQRLQIEQRLRFHQEAVKYLRSLMPAPLDNNVTECYTDTQGK